MYIAVCDDQIKELELLKSLLHLWQTKGFIAAMATMIGKILNHAVIIKSTIPDSSKILAEI